MTFLFVHFHHIYPYHFDPDLDSDSGDESPLKSGGGYGGCVSVYLSLLIRKLEVGWKPDQFGIEAQMSYGGG
jgi:hypothetical protein